MQNELPFNIRKTFKEIGYGALPVLTDTGTKFCMRIDRGMINTCIDKEHRVKLQIHNIDGFPLIRAIVAIYAWEEEILTADMFLDVFDIHHALLLDVLTKQDTVSIGWYDDKFRHIRTNEIPWPSNDRSGIAAMILEAHDMAEKDPERYVEYFMTAKTKYCKDCPS